jgi:hypothetical protein
MNYQMIHQNMHIRKCSGSMIHQTQTKADAAASENSFPDA